MRCFRLLPGATRGSYLTERGQYVLVDEPITVPNWFESAILSKAGLM